MLGIVAIVIWSIDFCSLRISYLRIWLKALLKVSKSVIFLLLKESDMYILFEDNNIIIFEFMLIFNLSYLNYLHVSRVLHQAGYLIYFIDMNHMSVKSEHTKGRFAPDMGYC